MNKKLLLFTLLFLLFSVSFVSARMCDTDNVLDVLRKALYIYYINPKASSFTANELKDLLGFYVGIQSGQVTIDCTEQSDNVDKANALPDNIPSCSDGTKYGKCSSNKPMYCYAGILVPRCRLCGCPTGQWCDITYIDTSKGNKGQWGKCYPGTNITCTVNADCGISNYVGDYYCNKDGDVYRNYTQYTCFNPGEINSNCTRSDRIILIDDCQATEQCVEGQAECQTTGNVTKRCDIKVDGVIVKTVYATDRQDCYNQTSFGSINCNVYTSYFKEGRNFLEQYFDVTDRVNNEYCDCQNGVCDQAKCSDGTIFYTCSTTKPKKCINGTLVDNCQTCGCDTGTCQANGSCQDEIMPTSIIIKGRMIDAVTGEPYANLRLVQGAPYVTLAYTDYNGYFIINVSNFTGADHFVSVGYCIYPGGVVVQWDSVNKRLYGRTGYLDACDFQAFSNTSEIDVGTFRLWPSASIKINADKPFNFGLHTLPNTCPDRMAGGGNILNKTEHILSLILPVNHRTEIGLAFEDGSRANTTSDMIKMEQKCQTVQLNYYNGQFSWGQTCSDGTAYAQCSTTKPKYCSNGTLIDNCQACGCGTGLNCNVNGSCIISQENCNMTGDEDGNGECDYDSTTCSHGDINCPVEVTALTVSNANPTPSSTITAWCTATLPVNSINLAIDGVGECTWQNWTGNIASFSCNTGSSTGNKTVRCSVNTAKSYKTGTDKTTTINVQTPTCSDGTPHGQCSITKPKYCENGILVDKCQTCSCEIGKTCQTNGSCITPTCTDGTLYGQCSTTKPKYCESGTLTNKCQTCGCSTGTCETDGSCFSISTRKLNNRYSVSYPPMGIYGDYVVYQVTEGGWETIYLFDLSTDTEKKIGTGDYPSIYGTKIAYKGTDGIHVYDLATNTDKKIANGNRPDIYGNKVVYEANKFFETGVGYLYNLDIYMYDLSTNTETPIKVDTNYYQRAPKISGDKIVWQGDTPRNLLPGCNLDITGQIYVYDLSTNTEKRITSHCGGNGLADIYGDRIVFWRSGIWGDYGDRPGIFAYDLSTNTEKPISHPGIYAQSYPLSIYGNKAVYNGGQESIYLYDFLTGKNIYSPLIGDINAQRYPAIYENKIVYSNTTDGKIYLATIS